MYNCIRSMKKVLIVFNHPAPYKVRLFNELSNYFEMHVIFERDSAKDRNKDFYFENKHNFISHKVQGIHLGKENFISRGIIKHIKETKYDLIIMNGYSTFAEMKTINFLKRKRIPYVLYINGGRIPKSETFLKKTIKTHFIKNAKAYLSPDEISNRYLVHYGAKRSLIFNYPYSTVFESEILKSKPNKKSLRNALNIKYEKFLVSSGQLIKRKNYLCLVNEWKNMPEKYGLFIFGDGPQRKEIEKLIADKKIKNVELKGFLPRVEMFKYFSCADAFIFPSKEDIYGHVINEALAQGIPVVSSKQVNSALKLVEKQKTGVLLESVNSKEILNAINELSKVDTFDYCTKKAKENSIELMVKKHVEIFKRILGR